MNIIFTHTQKKNEIEARTDQIVSFTPLYLINI